MGGPTCGRSAAVSTHGGAPATRRRPKRPGLWYRRTLLSMEDALRVVRYYCSTPVVSPGGSLAGTDSDDASSTLSQASPTVGVSAAGVAPVQSSRCPACRPRDRAIV